MREMSIDPLRASPPDASTEVWVAESIEATYIRLYPRLVRLAFLLVDTTDHAEEAVQDAFARAYPKWGRIQNHDAYMRTAVVNTCRRVQRHRRVARRNPQPPGPLLQAEEMAADGLGTTMPRPGHI